MAITTHYLDITPFDQIIFRIKTKSAWLAERLKFYSEYWAQMTRDGNVLFVVQIFKIHFSKTLFRNDTPARFQNYTFQITNVNQEKRQQINSEIQKILEKDSIQQIETVHG